MTHKNTISSIASIAEGTDLLEKHPNLLSMLNDHDLRNDARLLELLLGVASGKYSYMSLSQLYEEARYRGMFASRPRVLCKVNNGEEHNWFRLRFGRYLHVDQTQIILTDASEFDSKVSVLARSRPHFEEDVAHAFDNLKEYRYAMQAVFIAHFLDLTYCFDEIWSKTYKLRYPAAVLFSGLLKEQTAPSMVWFQRCNDPELEPESAEDASWLREVNNCTRVYIAHGTLVVEEQVTGDVVSKWCCNDIPIPTNTDTRLFMYHILMLLWMIGIKPSRNFVESCFNCEEVH